MWSSQWVVGGFAGRPSRKKQHVTWATTCLILHSANINDFLPPMFTAIAQTETRSTPLPHFTYLKGVLVFHRFCLRLFFLFFYFFWRMTGWVWGTERWANIKQQRFEANSGEGERNQQAGSRCCVCFGRLKWKGLVGCPTGCPQHFRRSSLWRSRNQSDVVYVTWVSTWVSTSLLFLLCSLRDCQQHLGKRKHADELTAIRIRFTILRWGKKEAWARK